MTNPWFKFYGSEFLSDQKMLQLTGNERSCWVTLLCLACQTKDGIVKFLSEKQLLIMSGVTEDIRVLQKFEELQMIEICNGNVTVVNWIKRQLSESVNRVREFRLKQKSNGEVTTEENREEKRRKEEIDIHRTKEYLKSLPKEDIAEFVKRFDATEKQIKSKAEDLLLYCDGKGKVYKDYKAFLLNALKKDFKERTQAGEKEFVPGVGWVKKGL